MGETVKERYSLMENSVTVTSPRGGDVCVEIWTGSVQLRVNRLRQDRQAVRVVWRVDWSLEASLTVHMAQP